MNNKITVVTGGNTGIGKATVAGLAQRGATVVIACRDVARGNAARDEIAASTGSSALHVMPLDLASLASVRAFAAAFLARFPRLDVLVANAGVMTERRQVTADGLEMNFGVNHDAKEKKPGKAALDDALAERLWTETERLVACAASTAPAAKPAAVERMD